MVERLRLLNINAPEKRSGAIPAECLSGEAAGVLIELAPRNTPLRVVRHGKDRYGRTLGEAWLSNGTMLGAEVVRRGLAAPLTVGGLAAYRPVIDAARDEAAAAHRGLHGTVPACTVPARVAELKPRDPAAAAVLADLESRTPSAGVAALTDAHRASLVATVMSRG
ncbi:thermonuclease family protein [Knoellia subterranea]|uniref:thermonuclease family protein n=1 Tax=Knoellia subterranea TaxID=184882 RepID=UPI00147025D6|nr:thermonuclease family protein [Knoellia subterranea]